MRNSLKASPNYVLELARKFRKDPTNTEEFLWECLRDRQLNGHKFRRQHPIGRYIADFYCHDANLVIELDGKYHTEDDRKIYDRIRDEELTLRGLKVLRIASRELIINPENVLSNILTSLNPSTSGRGAGGEGYRV